VRAVIFTLLIFIASFYLRTTSGAAYVKFIEREDEKFYERVEIERRGAFNVPRSFWLGLLGRPQAVEIMSRVN